MQHNSLEGRLERCYPTFVLASPAIRCPKHDISDTRFSLQNPYDTYPFRNLASEIVFGLQIPLIYLSRNNTKFIFSLGDYTRFSDYIGQNLRLVFFFGQKQYINQTLVCPLGLPYLYNLNGCQ